MLEAVNLGCVRGDRRLFRGLNFAIKPGEFIELRGPNGGGTTSLLRIISGLAPPAEGEVRWRGQNIRKRGEEYASEIAYVAHQNGVKSELSLTANPLIARRVSGNALSREQARQAPAAIAILMERLL